MKMEATEEYFQGFQKHLTKSGLAIPLDANKALVKRYLTAEFARQLYDDEKYDLEFLEYKNEANELKRIFASIKISSSK